MLNLSMLQRDSRPNLLLTWESAVENLGALQSVTDLAGQGQEHAGQPSEGHPLYEQTVPCQLVDRVWVKAQAAASVRV